MSTVSGDTLLLDHLIRPLQERLRDGQAEGLGGLEADHQVELRDVGGIRHRVPVHVGQDVLQLGGVVGVELAKDV